MYLSKINGNGSNIISHPNRGDYYSKRQFQEAVYNIQRLPGKSDITHLRLPITADWSLWPVTNIRPGVLHIPSPKCSVMFTPPLTSLTRPEHFILSFSFLLLPVSSPQRRLHDRRPRNSVSSEAWPITESVPMHRVPLVDGGRTRCRRREEEIRASLLLAWGEGTARAECHFLNDRFL